MTPSARQPTAPQFRQEIELIERYTACFRRQFDDAIRRLNAAPDVGADAQSVRLCVEAVNMMLATQGQMARLLHDLVAAPSPATPVHPRATRRPA